MSNTSKLPKPSGSKGQRGGRAPAEGRYAESEKERLKSSATSFSYPGRNRRGKPGPSTADEVPQGEFKDFSGQIR